MIYLRVVEGHLIFTPRIELAHARIHINHTVIMRRTCCIYRSIICRQARDIGNSGII